MRESGFYPPGAEFDPKAPYNEEQGPKCPKCFSVQTGIDHSYSDKYYVCYDCDHEWLI